MTINQFYHLRYSPSILQEQLIKDNRKNKKFFIKTLMRKILIGIFALTIFSILLLLSPIPKNIEAQKAESEIEQEMCVSYNKSEKLISITCKYADFSDISKKIIDPGILKLETHAVSNNNNKEKVWLLNSGLKIEENAILDNPFFIENKNITHNVFLYYVECNDKNLDCENRIYRYDLDNTNNELINGGRWWR